MMEFEVLMVNDRSDRCSKRNQRSENKREEDYPREWILQEKDKHNSQIQQN